MNTTDDNIEPTKIDEYQDRLIDRGLTELIGNETPPDVSGRILSAATASMPRPVDHTKSKRWAASRWLAVAVAASLLVGATLIAILPIGKSRMAAKESVKQAGLISRSLNGVVVGQTENTPLSGPTANDGIASESTDQRGLGNSVDTLASVGPTQLHSVNERFGDVQRLKKSAEFSKQLADQTPSDARTTRAFVNEARTIAPGTTSAPAESSEILSFHDRAARAPAAAESSLGVPFQKASGRAELPPGFQLGASQRRGGEAEMDVAAVSDLLAEVPQVQTTEGVGPDLSGDQYTRIVENPFIKAEGANAVSTFSIDVDTASYANVRQFLLDMNTLPPPDAVRIEELINYFDYGYAGPPANARDAADTPAVPDSTVESSAANESENTAPAPFAAHVEVAGCPWKPDHRLVRIGIKGREMDRGKRPRSNLVFLVDVSGSMNEPNKLPLVVYGLQQLARELGENDHVAIVVYASSEGLVLPSTPGSNQQEIAAALGQLQAGGSTAGGAGIQLAYQIAEDNFLEGGTNRVILCTDGDFNVGVTSTAELERMCEQKAKDTGVFLSVLGFGRGNLNDAMMEAIADHGNGNYHYVDNRTEARRVLVEEMTGTLVTIAKDVKIQVEFNPRQVAGYRLIGYENRMLRTEDFNDDTKDAGEIGAGHTVTALYEIVPAGQKVDVPAVDELKYQRASDGTAADDSAPDQSPSGAIASELLTLKMRYKQPDGDTSRKLEWAVTDGAKAFRAASGDFQFAAAVAGFGLLLRDSQYKGNLTFAAVVELAQSGIGQDEHGYRAEFLELVRRAKALRGE